MINQLALVQTLYFYDVPQLVLVKNLLGDLYLCLLSDEKTMDYLSVRISKDRAMLLIKGDFDLREAYTSPESDGYYVVSATEDGSYILSDKTVVLSEDLLPEEGFTLTYSHEEQEISIREDFLLWNKPILKLGVCNTENAHTIEVDKLSALTTSFSRFAQHLMTKRASKGEVIAPFVVYGTEAASFNLKMYVEFADPELFGSSADRYLKEIGDLLSWNGEETFRQDISELRGHTLKSLRSFICFLTDNKLSLKYQWLSNINNEPVFVHTNCANLCAIQSILQEKIELERVILTARGILTKASIERGGEWMLRSGSNEVISGKVEDLSILSGVVINNVYDIIYEDVIEEDVVSRKEHHRLILQSIETVSPKT